MSDAPGHGYVPEALHQEAPGTVTPPTLLDFGTHWRGHCRATGSVVAQALGRFDPRG
ncbi:MAG: hypothetical protein ACOVN7_05055 [Rubrivivax sp.]